MTNNDERDYAEEAANRAEMQDEAGHCGNDCGGTTDEAGQWDPGDDDCAHCECCCQCLGCEYGPRNSLLMTPEQTGGDR